jgi:hypothetical protein
LPVLGDQDERRQEDSLAYAGDAGTIVNSTVFLVSGVVDSTTVRPDSVIE